MTKRNDQGAAMGWNPIEAAPIGEDVLMVWPDGFIRIGSRYSANDTGFKSELDFRDFNATMYATLDFLPTHWMPLPKRPTSAFSNWRRQ